jgi:hypothetical protein
MTMTDEQYTRACQIKHQLILLQQAVGISQEIKSLELHRDKCSDMYGHNINTEHIFEVMKNAIISGLHNEIANLNIEFNQL